MCLLDVLLSPNLYYLYHEENMHLPGWFWIVRNLEPKVGVTKQIEMEMGDPQHNRADRGHATSPMNTF